jgi:predicted transcriptional regulator
MENKAGRPALFADKNAVVIALRAINGDEKVEVSRFLKLQLVERGLVVAVDVKSGGRGRPAKQYNLTGKGKTYLNFSKNWK